MQCKWIKVEGKHNNNTTRIFMCGLKNKPTDEYECRNCPMFIQNNNAGDIINRFFGTLGGKYGR